MSLTVELNPELEQWLEQWLEREAERTGTSPASVAIDVLRKSLSPLAPSTPSGPRLSPEETRLLEEINRGPATREMERYLTLIRLRQDEAAGEAEVHELRAFTQRMEELAVTRMQAVAALAELRGVDCESVMEQLQIQPPDVL